MRRALVLAAAVLVLTGGRLAAQDEKGIPRIDPVKIDQADDELTKLRKERFNAATAVLDFRGREFTAGRGTLDILLEAMDMVAQAQAALSNDPKQHLATLEKVLEVAREVDKINEARFNAGRISVADQQQSRYKRLDYEIRVAELKARMKKER
jgi:outer membrane protein TolC